MLRTIALVVALVALPGATNSAPTSVDPRNPNPTGAGDADFIPLGSSDPPNPLARYPRRPGAQYDDIEALPGAPVRLLGAQITLVQATIEPGPPPPLPPAPAPTFPQLPSGSLVPFEPPLDGAGDTVLHITLATDAPSDLTCSCTSAADGASAMAQARANGTDHADVYFPVGEHRGRFYVGCSRTVGLVFSGLAGGLSARAVWGVDV